MGISFGGDVDKNLYGGMGSTFEPYQDASICKGFFTKTRLPFHNKKVATVYSAPTLFQTCYSHPEKEVLFLTESEEIEVQRVKYFALGHRVST